MIREERDEARDSGSDCSGIDTLHAGMQNTNHWTTTIKIETTNICSMRMLFVFMVLLLLSKTKPAGTSTACYTVTGR